MVPGHVGSKAWRTQAESSLRGACRAPGSQSPGVAMTAMAPSQSARLQVGEIEVWGSPSGKAGSGLSASIVLSRQRAWSRSAKDGMPSQSAAWPMRSNTVSRSSTHISRIGMRLLGRLQSKVSRNSQGLFEKRQADRPDDKTPSRTSPWPISPLRSLVLRSTRPCLSCRRICGSPKLEPGRNYGGPTKRLRQS